MKYSCIYSLDEYMPPPWTDSHYPPSSHLRRLVYPTTVKENSPSLPQVVFVLGRLVETALDPTKVDTLFPRLHTTPFYVVVDIARPGFPVWLVYDFFMPNPVNCYTHDKPGKQLADALCGYPGGAKTAFDMCLIFDCLADWTAHFEGEGKIDEVLVRATARGVEKEPLLAFVSEPEIEEIVEKAASENANLG